MSEENIYDEIEIEVDSPHTTHNPLHNPSTDAAQPRT